MLSVLQLNNHSFISMFITHVGKSLYWMQYAIWQALQFSNIFLWQNSDVRVRPQDGECRITVLFQDKKESIFQRLFLFLTFFQPSRTIGQAPNTNRYLVRIDGSNRHFFPTIGAPDRRVCLVPILSLVTRKVTSITHRIHE
jgi:hypothetical protein